MPRTERLLADDAGLARAAELLRAGGLVAFPTETVYGLGARADQQAAALGIFEAKGRPASNPLIVHVTGPEAARELAVWTALASALAAAFWPGALTLVLERRPCKVADAVTAGGATVALRSPSHPVARALLAAAALPLAAPSANRATAVSPTTAAHVLKGLEGRIDAVVDGGPTGFGIESTIVDATGASLVLLRHGAVPLEALEAFAPVLDRGDAVAAPGEAARAPGAQARHYAPQARVILVDPSTVRAAAASARAGGASVGAIERGAATADDAAVEVLPEDAEGYAAGLYAALHRLEDARCDVVIVAEPPASRAWAAVRDRLRRASS